MPIKTDDFIKRLMATFKVEAQEHLQALSSGLLELEKTPADSERSHITETIFREAHSLKGAARSVNASAIESLCQPLEGVLAALKREEIPPAPALFDLLHEVVDKLGQLLSGAESEPAPEVKSSIRTLIQSLERAATGPLPSARLPENRQIANAPPAWLIREPERQSADAFPRKDDTVRISTTKLDSLLLQAEELLSAKLAAGQQAAALSEINQSFAALRKEWTRLQSELRNLQRAFAGKGKPNGQTFKPLLPGRLVELVEWTETRMESVEAAFLSLEKTIERDRRSLGGMVDNLLDDMKQVLMLPFASLLEILPKLVRDLARHGGKEVDLVIRGGDIEIDRRVLEELKVPLIHLVRNAIDHGIDKPEERAKLDKPARASITIAATAKDGGKVELLVADDGKGIQAAKVKQAAVRQRILSADDAGRLTETEMLSLIFESGFSTSEMITDLSGRGLGLAIVREKVEKLGGLVSVETQAAIGTTFRLTVPMTLATFRGVVVREAEHLFVLPTASVERVMRVQPEEIKTVENRPTVSLNGQPVSLVRLAEALELPLSGEPLSKIARLPAVLANSIGRRIAFLVDAVLNEQEVLVKPLGPQLARVRNIAGATILGTGKVAPILNVGDLMKSAVRAAASVAKPAAVSGAPKAVRKKSILVVEDSITARTLLKNILEAAGYKVETAVDGVDAFTKLRSGEFALVVSDVEMPRMHGFQLTTKIRGDRKLAELPVVLVTARESREDREQGIEVGANAYLVKSSFDQSNLLAVIGRLI